MPPDSSTTETSHRLVLVSNRGPVSFRIGDQNNLVARRGGGGLVTALSGLATHHDVTWVAHAMTDGDVAAARAAGGGAFDEVSRNGSAYRLRLVGERDARYQAFYNTIANPLLWFLQHRLWGFGQTPTIDRATHAAFGSYRDVNRQLAAAAVDELERAETPPVVLVHDYQLFLVPGFVREAHPAAFLKFFLHIPWPTSGAWRCVPHEWVTEIIESLLTCNLLGMQTRDDVRAFLQTCQDFVDADVDFSTGAVSYGDHVTHVRPFPISVAVDEFEEHARSTTVQRLRRRIQEMRPGADGKLIVRVDRSDPSKNLVRGFEAFSLLLHEHPELHGKVTMFCQLDPSRQEIREYAEYLTQIEAAADELNVQFATSTWRPLFINLDSNFLAAVAAYTEYDVLFVNPVADGMNLVSKEGPLVNLREGAVVLSEQAGSYFELGPYVIGVNPFDIAQQADALYEALTMPQEQRSARADAIREHVGRADIVRWMDDQLEAIHELRQTV